MNDEKLNPEQLALLRWAKEETRVELSDLFFQLQVIQQSLDRELKFNNRRVGRIVELAAELEQVAEKIHDIFSL